MSKSTKQIVILDKVNSQYIEQAIFILKELPEATAHSDIVHDAEEIVNNYIKRMNYSIGLPPSGKKKIPKNIIKFVNGLFWLSIFLGCLSIFILLVLPLLQ